MVNAISTSTSLALTSWPPTVSRQISFPAKHCLAIRLADSFAYEEGEFVHHRELKSEDLGYDRHGRVIQRNKKGFIIDFYG